MRDTSDIRLDRGKTISIGSVTADTTTARINYTGFDGTAQTIVLPSEMSDQAKRLSIRHREWMRMYPVIV